MKIQVEPDHSKNRLFNNSKTKNMYNKLRATKSSIQTETAMEGEMIETKVKRILTNREPIKDGAPVIYTDRKDGVLPGYDIRTDRFEVAVEAADIINKSHKAKREERHKTPEQKESEKRAKEAKENMQKEGEKPANEGGA